jgi:hypothetical protein
MTSRHETCRERIALARETASIMTMSDGRTGAEVVCGRAWDTAIAEVPAADARVQLI